MPGPNPTMYRAAWFVHDHLGKRLQTGRIHGGETEVALLPTESGLFASKLVSTTLSSRHQRMPVNSFLAEISLMQLGWA